MCAEEVGGSSLCSLKGKYKARTKLGAQAGKTAGKAREGKVVGICWAGWRSNRQAAFGIFFIYFLFFYFYATDPALGLPSVLGLDPATVRRASYPQTSQLFDHCCSADKSRRKLLCVCVCVCADGEELKLKAEAKAERREEYSTKGACVLQLGPCVCVCTLLWTAVSVYVSRCTQTFACKGCPQNRQALNN